MSSEPRTPLSDYHRLADWQTRWAEWERLGVARSRVARTHQGREVAGFELGPESAPRALLLGGVHAMEWIGVETAAGVFECLRSAAGALTRRVLYVPILNVDGFARVEADLTSGKRRFRRTNAAGVDLNRNFPSHWRPQNGRGRLLPFLGHAGTGPRSEPEVDGLLTWLDARLDGASLDRALSLHSIGRRVLYPYGGQWAPPEDASAHRKAGTTLRNSFHERYKVTQCSRWVPGAFAYGLEIDHFHDHYGALSLLVECSGGGFRLTRPSTWLSPPRWFNPASPQSTAEGLAEALAGFLA